MTDFLVQTRSARFVSIVEPYRDQPMIDVIEPSGADRCLVKLTDGRTQELTIRGLASDHRRLQVTLQERQSGRQAHPQRCPCTR